MKINRLWLADTLALMSFTIITGMFIEIAIVGMTVQQSIQSRILCQPINILTGRMYGIYRDNIIVQTDKKIPGKGAKIIGDILAYITFQLPLYIGILWVIGMDISSIVKAAFTQTAALLVLGAPYGYWLTKVRAFIIPAPVSVKI
ncbi:L-alanine exporter AlaE [Moritella sp. Urea-trap-13]|uniref:L-alanine exporter AlaE n=1 Tax=Moritella sp. Urea-trap-13 TaxID=2058327 RepID=UPI000C3290A2|nr:L-alanine exporter AlaE [Moritella sp. Urea-trap-13]PKH07478.1 L-alanine exporter AlaE [Moritella sp. Urea-trap-13]